MYMWVMYKTCSFDEYSLIGNDGSVWTRWRKKHIRQRVEDWWLDDVYTRVQAETPRPDSGYVSIRIHGVRQLLHIVVLETFVGACPVGMQCRHLDGNSSHNWLSNLCWGTQSENEADKRLHGTDQRGERNGWALLTEREVRQLKLRFKAGEDVRVLEAEYGTTTRRILNGKVWRHVNV